jgi:branched-chain amino acid transport system permease protein
MVNGLNLAFQFLDSFAFIVLAAVGLAIIFGIMGVINLAHGEFIMVGAYGTTLSANAGVPLLAAMGVGVACTAVFGVVVERVVISGTVVNWLSERLVGRAVVSPMYDRLLDSMVATWGLSLIMIEGARVLFGNSLPSIGTPLGTIYYGDGFSTSMYGIVLAAASVATVAGVYLLFTRTRYGMRARATIQNEEMAGALGVDTERTYMVTFVAGSALAGLTGALYAPTLSIGPGLGTSFLVEAFVAVVVGGTNVIAGTLLGGGVLGFINAVFSNLYGTFFGRIALLVFAIVVLRFLPRGLTGLVERVRERGEGW